MNNMECKEQEDQDHKYLENLTAALTGKGVTTGWQPLASTRSKHFHCQGRARLQFSSSINLLGPLSHFIIFFLSIKLRKLIQRI